MPGRHGTLEERYLRHVVSPLVINSIVRYRTYNGDIGRKQREVEFEPLDLPIEIPEPIPAPAPSEPARVPEKVPVPA